jgi:hypothetical protein
MERRGCGLGCIIAALGLVLSCCLFPHLVSSVYALVSTLLANSTSPTWLWGDWLGTAVGTDSLLYIILAEGPICCAGIIALLIIILGVVAVISSSSASEQEPEVYEEPEEWDDIDSADAFDL